MFNEQIGEEIKGELLEKFKSNLDLDKVKTVYREKFGLEMIDNVELIGANEILSHDGQIALPVRFKLSFDSQMMIDLKGNCISVSQNSTQQPSTPEEHIEEAGSQAEQSY
jgi:hypothetical protein